MTQKNGLIEYSYETRTNDILSIGESWEGWFTDIKIFTNILLEQAGSILHFSYIIRFGI